MGNTLAVQLSNFCSLCGAGPLPASRRNAIQIPGRSRACVCATCLRRMDDQDLWHYLPGRIFALKEEIATAERILESFSKAIAAFELSSKLRTAADQTGIAKPRHVVDQAILDAEAEADAAVLAEWGDVDWTKA